MTHQPPIPEAATSPYPLRPAPIAVSEAKPRQSAARKTENAGLGGLSNTVIGIGAAIGISAVAAIGGVVLARRRRTGAKASSKASPKSRRGKADDTRKRGAADRRRVAAGQPYEVAYFARKHKISTAEARDIIQEAGPDRNAANALASKRAAASVH
ncbi:hypothetical protein AWL63_07585 [Sphingomonas panacis]|uniref:DUF3606 domain-containing protein n=1 Tax=Sphingomonas panacis TaxID=1560345 RepID=A0A1B3Z8U0_9SPHN|nr:DUF3606 domain-containing protein [Sphingomonas panacis]AOH83846.1 hypothetical protein AWL63_07585 [Sphingomonas panacis]